MEEEDKEEHVRGYLYLHLLYYTESPHISSVCSLLFSEKKYNTDKLIHMFTCNIFLSHAERGQETSLGSTIDF